MTGFLDIYFHYLNGIEENRQTFPGYHIAQKPHHPNRGRKNDRLFLFMSLEGNAAPTAERQEQLLSKLAQIYYQTPGSITSGLRTVARSLNQYLFERNQKSAATGERATANINQVVVRQNRLYIAQSGTACATLIRESGTQVVSDQQLSGKGLGFSRTAPIYFSQFEIKPGDYYLFTQGNIQEIKPENLIDAYTNDALQYVKYLAGLHVPAILLQSKPGTGKISPLAEQTIGKEKQRFSRIGPKFTDNVPSSPEEKEMQEAISRPPLESHSIGIASEKPQLEYEAKNPKKSTKNYSSRMVKISSSMIDLMNETTGRIGNAAKTLLQRVLPGDPFASLPGSVMLIIAVIVPILVVSIASLIYFRSGRTNQYISFYDQAQQLFEQAQTLTDSNLQRLAWENTLANLDQAELYQSNNDTANLRSQTLQKLDELDGIKRLDMQPALTISLPEGTQITQITASGNELFMLNNNQGNILRAVYTSSGYDLDDSFKCGPDETNTWKAGGIIDLFVVPEASQLNASVYALDINGNFIECAAGSEPSITALTPAPTGMGSLKGFTMSLGNLFVFDPEKNAVWIYWKSKVNEEPELFFSESVPELKDVIDFTVSESDLYMLHSDGHMTLCTYSNWGGAPTRCTDPANFLDSRKGKEKQVLKPDQPFTSVFASSPPDPSLYLFEPQTPAIYHFSLRQLAFHRQYQPSKENSSIFNTSPASAFAINMDTRMFYLAHGVQIYYANIP